MILVCDIGGTTLRIARSRTGRTLSDGDIRQTPQTYEELVRTIIGAGLRWSISASDCCVIGLPGTRNNKGEITSCPFIPSMLGKNLARDVASGLDLPANKIIVVNDAFAVGLGELVYGAGIADRPEGVPDLETYAFITVSTGVGGALYPRRLMQVIMNRSLTREDLNQQFEPGRMLVDIDQGTRTLESIISGASVAGRTGKKPREIVDMVFWSNMAQVFSAGLWNIITISSPQTIIVGGPMVVRSPGIDIHKSKAFLSKLNTSNMALPKIVLSTLGDYGGLYGCLVIAKSIFGHTQH